MPEQVQGAGVQRLLSQACMRLAAGLTAAGRLPPHPAPFNSPAQHFEQRFGRFNALQRPEPLTHMQFTRSVDVTCASLLSSQLWRQNLIVWPSECMR